MEVNSQIELYDSDMIKIREVFHKINDKYSSRRDTIENIRSLVSEAEDLFRQCGFEVTVALPKHMLSAMGVPPMQDSPPLLTFSIDSRVGILEFDHDRAAWEAKHQIIDDDVARKFTEQGGTSDQRVIDDTVVDIPHDHVSPGHSH
jgi:hypothetical protein